MQVIWRNAMRFIAGLAVLTATAAPAFAAGASIWPSSRVPMFDTDGQPMVGAMVSFFNCGTTTPQVVYEDGDLSIPLSQPIEADARGMFPAIYLSGTPGCYRVKLQDADEALVYDDDNIAVSQTADFSPPDAGETSEELLFRTGMLEPYYGTTAPSGWVRCNGRTIGSASSGATERANADTQDLFEHLWTVDSTLTVSSGRGASAASDFAANKTITLPDCRERNLAGLATMGNSDAGLVADAYVDGDDDSSDLGATAGVDDVTLTVDQMPAHNHGGTTSTDGAHTHTYDKVTIGQRGLGSNSTAQDSFTSTATSSSGSHSHTISSQGGGQAHNNMAPTMFVTILIKL